MLKEAYERGYECALEKIGFRFGSALGTAGKNVGKSESGVRFTRSLSQTKGMSTKGRNMMPAMKRQGATNLTKVTGGYA